ncbi:hypothetical protein WDU94_015183 [Cyamophila willieti]
MKSGRHLYVYVRICLSFLQLGFFGKNVSRLEKSFFSGKIESTCNHADLCQNPTGKTISPLRLSPSDTIENVRKIKTKKNPS